MVIENTFSRTDEELYDAPYMMDDEDEDDAGEGEDFGDNDDDMGDNNDDDEPETL